MDAGQLNIVMAIWIWAFFAFGMLLLTLPLFVRTRQIFKIVGGIRAATSGDAPGGGVQRAAPQGTTLAQLQGARWLREPAAVFERVWRAAIPREREKAVDAPHLSHYLRPQHVLPGFANRRLANALPGVLVALGILGTFLGLERSITATGNISSAANGEASANLQLLVDNVISGMGLAFTTSILGIALSVVFILIDRIGVHWLERGVIELSDVVHEQFPTISRAELAREQFDLLQESSQNIQTLGTDLASALESALEAQMRPAMQAIQGSVEELVSFSAREQVDGVKGLVENFTASMNEALGNQFTELQEILASTVRSQQEIGTGLQDFGSTIRDSAEVQRALIQQTSRAAETLTGSLDRLELISGLLKDAADDVLRAGAQLERSAGAAAESQNSALAAQKQLLAAAETHSIAMTSAREELEASWRRAVDEATGTIEQIREATREFTVGVGDQLVVALGKFDGALAGTIERFSGTLVQVDASVSELPAAAESMRESAELTTGRVAELNATVSSLSGLVSGLVSENVIEAARAASELKGTVNSAEDASRRLAQLATSLVEKVAAISTISAELEESRSVARDSVEQLERLTQQLSTMGPNLQGVASALDGNGRLGEIVVNLAELTKGLERVRESRAIDPPDKPSGFLSRFRS